MKLSSVTWSELKQLDKKTVAILMVCIGCLIGINFFTNASKLPFVDQLIQGQNYLFYHNLFWVISSILFYVVPPCFTILFFFKEQLSDYGLIGKQLFGYYKIYLLIFLSIFPLLVVASYTSSFRATYPFYVPAQAELMPKYFIWEFFYVLQFFALEFFFRGFLVHGLKKEWGIYSVFIMTVPYCMIHFNKPLAECVGSIFAGVFLGLMSFKTQSIWMGSLLHTAVALSMNWLSLWHRGYF